MTTAKDLSGTWPVAAFHRAIADAHLDLEQLSKSKESCVPALTACGVLPPGWPEVRARGLAHAMIWVMDWRDTPHYRDTFVTDARGRIVYHDGWDDLRVWMEELDIEMGLPDPPGALRPLLAVVGMPTLTERLGPDRMEAFVTKLRQEGPEPEKASGWAVEAPDLRWTFIGLYVGQAAELGRYAGLKYENVALLEQARRDEAVARAAWKRVQELRPEWCREWLDAPPAPDDPARE